MLTRLGNRTVASVSKARNIRYDDMDKFLLRRCQGCGILTVTGDRLLLRGERWSVRRLGYWLSEIRIYLGEVRQRSGTSKE
jgi:hypothetical protein